MATQVQNRRGSTSEHASFTGAVGEITVDTTKKTVVVHDGTTAGGAPLMRENGAQALVTTGTSTAASFIPTSSTVPSNGLYLSGMNTVALATASTGRLFVDASGSVGIGHSPTAIFSVLGNARVQTSASGSVGYEIYNGTRNTGISSDFANSITFIDHNQTLVFRDSQNAYAEHMRLSSSGHLGLGTSSPSYKLDVRGGNAAVINTGTDSVIYVGEGLGVSEYMEVGWTASTNTGRLTTTGTGALSLDTNSTSRLFITNTGNVGIGDNAPGSTLTVKGATGVTPLQISGPSSELCRVTSDGKLLVGTSTARSNFFNSTVSSAVHIESLSDSGRFLSLVNSGSGGSGGGLILGSSKSGTLNGNGLVSANGEIGLLSFQGNDGTEFVEAARIEAAVDGTPGTNDMPGRLVFSTTADGASSPTERVRITSGGYFKASNDGTYQGATGTYHEYRQTANSDALYVTATNGSFTSFGFAVNVTKAANANYSMAQFFSGGGADREFNFTGDGNGFCDGAWTGGGADYAEYFEWSDGNPDADDRRGIAVVLDGDKIRPAIAGEDPIGVISGNPSVVGDSAWNKWSGKYLRDDFGTYIQEDYEVINDEGKTVIQQRRKLNPAYDPDVEYTSREERPEWDCVGLMGKLRIRKGQPTGSRWIKMRDISATVEEWLVR